MNFTAIDAVIMMIYLAATIYTGLRVKKIGENSEGYFVAGRKVGLSLGVATLVASEIGIVTFMYMAEFGFTQFKVGRYSDAERVFKVLTVLDWKNPYYHSVMGSILHRQKRYGEAIAEYSQAIDLDDKDVVSYTNRGEIFMQHGLMEEARSDLEKAVGLDPEEKDIFAGRALKLLKQLLVLGKKSGGK